MSLFIGIIEGGGTNVQFLTKKRCKKQMILPDFSINEEIQKTPHPVPDDGETKERCKEDVNMMEWCDRHLR